MQVVSAFSFLFFLLLLLQPPLGISSLSNEINYAYKSLFSIFYPAFLGVLWLDNIQCVIFSGNISHFLGLHVAFNLSLKQSGNTFFLPLKPSSTFQFSFYIFITCSVLLLYHCQFACFLAVLQECKFSKERNFFTFCISQCMLGAIHYTSYTLNGGVDV